MEGGENGGCWDCGVRQGNERSLAPVERDTCPSSPTCRVPRALVLLPV